jgi:hypothetical protein
MIEKAYRLRVRFATENLIAVFLARPTPAKKPADYARDKVGSAILPVAVMKKTSAQIVSIPQTRTPPMRAARSQVAAREKHGAVRGGNLPFPRGPA